MDKKECPKCGSTYIHYRRKEETVDSSITYYYCESCQKEVVFSKVGVNRKWLLTFYADRFLYDKDDRMEIYVNSDGTITNVQYERHDNKLWDVSRTPKLYLCQIRGKYYLRADTFRTPNDITGTLVDISRVKMNDELTQEALKQEAMRSIYNRRENCFDVPASEYTTMLQDVCTWLQGAAHSPQTSKVKEAAAMSGCYVATAVYGSYDCPEVWTLRRFRDYTLANTWYGRGFIYTYYAISPTLVKWFGHTEWFKRMWKGKLDWLVQRLQNEGYSNTPYVDKEW